MQQMAERFVIARVARILPEQVPQCGYCQSGQILTAVAQLSRDKNPSDEIINRTMNGLCRCGTYPRIKKAIKKAGNLMET